MNWVFSDKVDTIVGSETTVGMMLYSCRAVNEAVLELLVFDAQ